MMRKNLLLALMLLVVYSSPKTAETEIPALENPMSVQYLEDHLLKAQPRLVLNPENDKILRAKLETDPVVQNMYSAIKLNAERILDEPVAERIVTGRRLLSVSREVLYRMNMLGMVYHVDGEQNILDRIDAELKAVCTFSDWNPSHFLDVAEMSLAVALALDWTAGALPPSTIELAQQALIDKGLAPSFAHDHGWIDNNNNWNQVCHGGLIAAAITIAEIDPELASNTISRALDDMPHALVEYGPDGVYPEGATYWGYGTSFSVITSAMLASAFGTDFGLGNYPGFQESAMFRKAMIAPSGRYFNYGDCGDRRSSNGDVFLAWFAAQTGNAAFFEKERFMRPPDEMGELSRLAGAALVWLAQYEKKIDEPMPAVWIGTGNTPIAVFQRSDSDHDYYFAAKGGRAADNHANMDNGSFVFELNGVRWAVDPGNQSYHDLEKTGFNLWGRDQDSQRWTLLTKNNFGHSTLTVNDSFHRVNGRALLLDSQKGEKPRVSFDLSPTFGELLKSATRTFTKDSPTSILIEDAIELSEQTDVFTWQLLTTADVEIVDGGALLRQDGQSLKLENLSHPQLMVSVISLDPPPLELDRRISDLKRIDIRIPAWTIKEDHVKIRVRLSAD